jgi:hypothetical protein
MLDIPWPRGRHTCMQTRHTASSRTLFGRWQKRSACTVGGIMPIWCDAGKSPTVDHDPDLHVELTRTPRKQIMSITIRNESMDKISNLQDFSTRARLSTGKMMKVRSTLRRTLNQASGNYLSVLHKRPRTQCSSVDARSQRQEAHTFLCFSTPYPAQRRAMADSTAIADREQSPLPQGPPHWYWGGCRLLHSPRLCIRYPP